MIIRVFRARVYPDKVEEFERFFLNKAMPNVKAQRGLISVTVGKPLERTQNEFLMIMVWKDVESLKGFAGEQWQEAVIDPDEKDLLMETFVYHYELASGE